MDAAGIVLFTVVSALVLGTIYHFVVKPFMASRRTTCDEDLNRMVKRVLKNELNHEGKIYLINLLFGGTMPLSLIYRDQCGGSPYRGDLGWVEDGVSLITGSSRVQHDYAGRRTGTVVSCGISISSPSRIVPQFTLTDGTTFVLCKADRGDLTIDFEKGTVTGTDCFKKRIVRVSTPRQRETARR